MRIALAFAVVLGACGSGGGGAPVDSSGSGTPDASVPVGYQMLISRAWSMPAGTEGYKCVRVQVPTEMWVSAFRSLSPLGTHHSVLTIAQSATTTGDYDCGVTSLDSQMLYAAGVDTDDNEFPPGVAIHLAAGTYLNLNLHLYNTTDGALSDTSGVLVKTVAQSAVVNEADMQFTGTMNFSIPPNASGDTTTTHAFAGHCVAAHDFHIFTLWPHMHQIATHQKFTINGTAVLDSDYAFTEQKNYPMTDTLIHGPVAATGSTPAKPGDTLETTCTFVNTTGHTVTFGESSDDEMCFTGVYRYPPGGNLYSCVTGGSI